VTRAAWEEKSQSHKEQDESRGWSEDEMADHLQLLSSYSMINTYPSAAAVGMRSLYQHSYHHPPGTTRLTASDCEIISSSMRRSQKFERGGVTQQTGMGQS